MVLATEKSNTKVIIKQPGSVNQLELAETPMPQPAANEVLIRVLYSGVAFGDVMFRKGVIPARYPMTPGYDITGVIVANGSNCRRYQVGQRVAAFPFTGGYASYICLSEDRLVPLPDEVDAAEAVCVILNYSTAYHLLKTVGKLQHGDSVLIHGAAGGVGTAALQLCKTWGITAYGTVSTGKIAAVENEGGIAIDYTKTDFLREIKRITASGVNAVLDPIAGPHLYASYKALQPGGKLILFGASNATTSKGASKWALFRSMLPFLLLKLRPGSKSVHYFGIQAKGAEPVIAQMLELLRTKTIRPLIARIFPLSEVREAQRFLEEAKPVGKVILENVNR